MYTYTLPLPYAVSFTDHLQTSTFHAELTLATQLRATVEQTVRSPQSVHIENVRVIQAVTEYLPVLAGVYNSLLMDTVVERHELVFPWRSALGRNAKYTLRGITAELCAMHMLLGMALANEAAVVVEALGLYELDTSLDTATRRQNDERLKIAADLLCRAAGVFDYVAVELLPKWESDVPRPPELTRDVATALVRLSMADAHHLAVRKLQSPALALATDTLTPGPPLPAGHPSPALLAKLHLHTALLYGQAASLVRTHETRAPLPAGVPDAEASTSRQPMHKLKSTLQHMRPAQTREAKVGASVLRYATHEAKWHRALSHKWLGIDAGEQGKQTGVGLAHLQAASEQLHAILPKGTASGESKPWGPLWEQRRTAKFHGDLGLWWMSVEAASVARWLDVYRRLNDSVSFQRVPPLAELQYASEGRAALVAKPFEPPVPRFGPAGTDVLDTSQCVGLSDRGGSSRPYAGAGAYY